ncbi:hypothetical protein ACWCOW_35385 [Streptomyces sp. NPDC001939]
MQTEPVGAGLGDDVVRRVTVFEDDHLSWEGDSPNQDPGEWGSWVRQTLAVGLRRLVGDEHPEADFCTDQALGLQMCENLLCREGGKSVSGSGLVRAE